MVAALKSPPLPYWRILRKLDRFSGDATVTAMRAPRSAPSPNGALRAEKCDDNPLDGLKAEYEDASMGPLSATYARV